MQFSRTNGLRLCSEFRSKVETRYTPILILSEDHDKSNLVKALDVGANDYLTVPLDESELIARINLQVKHKRFGGEEFVVVMPDASISDAYVVAERIRKIIAMEPFTFSDKNKIHNVTVSIGITEMQKSDLDNIKKFIVRADRRALTYIVIKS
ncbi:unnamed protein product [Onchocerca ochengi]|uniref:Response regulatory domain-containing protein n=1 Tax=Onchocerca ochengi TaxID=42157 RepID=A0A182ER23_ONCOC|nr:unnamed protein product [Onchocerca ochengi]